MVWARRGHCFQNSLLSLNTNDKFAELRIVDRLNNFWRPIVILSKYEHVRLFGVQNTTPRPNSLVSRRNFRPYSVSHVQEMQFLFENCYKWLIRAGYLRKKEIMNQNYLVISENKHQLCCCLPTTNSSASRMWQVILFVTADVKVSNKTFLRTAQTAVARLFVQGWDGCETVTNSLHYTANSVSAVIFYQTRCRELIWD